MQRRRKQVTVSCEVCSHQCLSNIKLQCQPFIAGVTQTFNNWLISHRDVLIIPQQQCKVCVRKSSLEKWKMSSIDSRLEVESRIKTMCPGAFPFSPETTIEMLAGNYRLRNGCAITKVVLDTEIVFDINGNFVRRVASLESWPVTYYSLLAHRKEKIDWSRQRVIDRQIDTRNSNKSCTRSMLASGIGYNEILEHETNYKNPPFYENLQSCKFETFPFTLNTTHVPSKLMLDSLLSDPSTYYSPKIDGERRYGTFCANGIYIEDPKTGLIEFVKLPNSLVGKLTGLPQLLIECVNGVFFVIDVCIDSDVSQRVAFINWLRKFDVELSLVNIWLQVYLTYEKVNGWIDSWEYKLENDNFQVCKVDGFILSPAIGKTQYKLKQHWTVDLQLCKEKMCATSSEGFKIVRLELNFFKSPKFTGDGIYECRVFNQGSVEIIKRRNDRIDANLIVSIFKNIEMSNSSLTFGN